LNDATFRGWRSSRRKPSEHVSLSGLALAWVMSSPLVTAPIIRVAQSGHFQPVREALTALQLTEGNAPN
jgi:aryl-alcohol dehydrogenase-like predicted oxidoreductase